mgnify:CR=1 FL=1
MQRQRDCRHGLAAAITGDDAQHVNDSAHHARLRRTLQNDGCADAHATGGRRQRGGDAQQRQQPRAVAQVELGGAAHDGKAKHNDCQHNGGLHAHHQPALSALPLHKHHQHLNPRGYMAEVLSARGARWPTALLRLMRMPAGLPPAGNTARLAVDCTGGVPGLVPSPLCPPAPTCAVATTACAAISCVNVLAWVRCG